MKTLAFSSRGGLGALFAAALFALSLGLVGCSDDGGKGSPDARVDGPAEVPSCYAGVATTHEQLMNACTPPSVEKIDKKPTLPRLNADGTLPPLP